MSNTIYNSTTPSSGLLKTAIIRSVIAALVIGSLLTLINQRGALFGAGEIAVLPLILVFQTPFLVVLAAQVLAIRRAQAEHRLSGAAAGQGEKFIETLTGHGIPFRAFVLGVLAGGLNTSIIITANIATTGAALPLPTVLLSQAFILPMLFGLLSQSLAYRRMTAQINRGHAPVQKGTQS